ncbi:MAG: DUF5615 family PIN-like protein, partial [Candidatus Bathyarchaeia archaeon]
MRKPKLLLDENIGFKVYEELRNRGFAVQSVIVEDQGERDTEVIELAKKQDKIIVTIDKEF